MLHFGPLSFGSSRELPNFSAWNLARVPLLIRRVKIETPGTPRAAVSLPVISSLRRYRPMFEPRQPYTPEELDALARLEKIGWCSWMTGRPFFSPDPPAVMSGTVTTTVVQGVRQ